MSVEADLLTWQKEGKKKQQNVSLVKKINVSVEEPSRRETRK